MKLFGRYDRNEGQSYGVTSVVMWGYQLQNGVRNGWYILFNMHFITSFQSTYVDPCSFMVRPSVCFLRTMVSYRLLRGVGPRVITHRTVWCPTYLLEEK